jgi:hypothetical protein
MILNPTLEIHIIQHEAREPRVNDINGHSHLDRVLSDAREG